MLTDMLKSNPDFQVLPLDLQDIYLRLSLQFQDDPDAIHADPSELAERFQIGNHHQWQALLDMEPTINYVKQQMTSRARIASRKAFVSLETEASSGDVPAIKHINELAGLLEKKDQNKIIILHQIVRPPSPQDALTPQEAST